MRARLVVLAVVVAFVAAVWSWWPAGDDAPIGTGPEPALVRGPASPGADAAAAPPLVATRTLASNPNTEGLADQPTAWLLVVDRDHERPVAGAAVRRVQTGAELMFTDERGLASVPLLRPEQLAVVADGYLLRLAPTQVGSTEAEPQRVLLVRDTWSLRRRFQFATPTGALAEDAFVRFRPREVPGASPVPPAPPGDAVVQRAWSEHVMLAGLAVCGDVPVQLGAFAEGHVHRLADGAEVRFVAPGEFAIEVATVGGLVARATCRIERTASAAVETVRIPLEPGGYVAGTVLAPPDPSLPAGEAASAGDPQPLAGAELSVQGGEPLGLLATTAADGRFRLGPLASGQVTLHVRHGDHQALAFGPVASADTGLRILMQPLPRSTLRGRVRARPDLLPIAGASVAWTPPGGSPVTATTGADGMFLLRATGSTAARLVVSAPGQLHYSELVAPGAPFADYDLWPGTTAARLAKGLTAVLQGVVVDAEGRALPNVAVRWIPARRSEPVGTPGRRVLDGGVLDLPLLASTGLDGAFSLETNQFGPGRLSLAAAGPAATGGVDTEATAGATRNGLRLQR